LASLVSVEYDFDFRVRFHSDTYGGAHYKIILYVDRAIWCYLMLKKDLYTVHLWRFFLLQDFDFEVRDKDGT